MRYDKNLLTAIIVCQIPGEKNKFIKYRNIKDATPQIAKLETHARTFEYAHHINLYYKGTKRFYKQILL